MGIKSIGRAVSTAADPLEQVNSTVGHIPVIGKHMPKLPSATSKLFGRGESKAAKAMHAAERAAKKQKLLDNFGPTLHKAQKDGRNVVSAKRALQGERIVDSAYKPIATSGGETGNHLAMTDRGVLGNRIKRNDSIAADIKEKQKFKDEKVFDAIQKESARAKLVSRQDDSAVHRVSALRNEKSAVIQGNQAGYDNPRLAPVPRQMGAPPAVAPASMPQTWRNQTYNNIPNRTGASKALASRMNSYR